MSLKNNLFMIAVAAVILLTGDLHAELLRLRFGPYAQFLSPSSVKICWQTNQPEATVLEYAKQDNQDNTIMSINFEPSNSPCTAILQALEPAAKYTYTIKAAGREDSGVAYELDTAFNYTVTDLSQLDITLSDASTAELCTDAAKRIISETQITKGYCIVYGFGSGQLACELAKRSELIIVGVDDDEKAVAKARRKLIDAGVYGPRITVRHVRSLDKLPFTKHFANLVVSETLLTKGISRGNVEEIRRVLRPDGGTAYIGIKPKDTADGVWAKIIQQPLEGAGTWTHHYANAGNSANSTETLNHAAGTGQLQVQWLGRPEGDFGIDRNPRMPAPLAVKGRLYHQGMNRLIALDAYNGAVLWSMEIPDLRRVNLPRDASNWCADENFVYVAIKDKCWVLDGYSGKLKIVCDLPGDGSDKTHDWGYVAVIGKKLFGSSVKKGSEYTEFWGGGRWYDSTSGYGTAKVCSDNIFACEAYTGKMAWTYNNGVIINTTIGIGEGKVYFAESRNSEVKALATGQVDSDNLWQDQFLVALDADSGEKLWEKPIDTADGIVVFHLIYHNGRIIISSSGSNEYNLYAFDAADGQQQWQAKHKWPGSGHSYHAQHPAISGGVVYLEPCGYDITTGKLVTSEMGRHEGCATYAATSDALIYRGQSRRIAMWDRNTGKVSSWFNLRPSCWLSVIPACGMVLAPEGGAGCSCGEWMYT